MLFLSTQLHNGRIRVSSRHFGQIKQRKLFSSIPAGLRCRKTDSAGCFGVVGRTFSKDSPKFSGRTGAGKRRQSAAIGVLSSRRILECRTRLSASFRGHSDNAESALKSGLYSLPEFSIVSSARRSTTKLGNSLDGFGITPRSVPDSLEVFLWSIRTERRAA